MASTVAFELKFGGSFNDTSNNALRPSSADGTFTDDVLNRPSAVGSFNGIDQRVVYDNNAAWKVFDGDFVILSRFRKSNTPPADEYLFRAKAGGTTSGVLVSFLNGGVLRYRFGNGTENVTLTSTGSNDDTWQTLWIQRIGTDLKVFLNDMNTEATSVSSANDFNPTTDLYIAVDNDLIPHTNIEIDMLQFRDGTTSDAERNAVTGSLTTIPSGVLSTWWQGANR